MKRKTSKKLTPNQIAFKKEVKRIKRFIHNAEKRGYEFDSDILPKQPKRVTHKKLEEIKNIKPSNLYNKAVYYDEVTHETFTGQQGRRIERYRASLKAKKTRQENKKNKEKNIIQKNHKNSDVKNTKNKHKNTEISANSTQEYYPTVDVIDEIGERLVNVDYVMNKLTDNTPENEYRYVWKRKSSVDDYEPSWFYSNIWAETIRKYEAQNALNALEEYAKDNALEITNCIDIVYWASKKEEEGNWQRLSSRLVILLKGGEIPTLDEAQQLGELQEQNDLVSDSYED